MSTNKIKKKQSIKDNVLLLLKKISPVFLKPISSIYALIIGIAIGLAPIWYNNYLSEPELVGRIISMASSDNAVQEMGIKNKVIHTIFLSIANKRKIPVSVIDYEIKFYQDDKLVRTCLPYYLNTKGIILDFNSFQWKLTFGDQYLLNNTDKLISIDKPIAGYIVFDGGTYSSISRNWTRLELTIYDAFGNDYIIESNSDDFRPPNLLPFLIKELEIINK